MTIALIGYMGSGKSTIGKALSKSLELPFVDLDEQIEIEANASIPEIFDTQGPIHFRKLESQMLRKVLEEGTGMVLSLGGGTPCYSNNMKLLKESRSISVYLKLTIGELERRLLTEKQHRPLIRDLDNDGLAEFIGKHLFERSPFYNQADMIVECDNKTVEAIVAQIQLQLDQVK